MIRHISATVSGIVSDFEMSLMMVAIEYANFQIFERYFRRWLTLLYVFVSQPLNIPVENYEITTQLPSGPTMSWSGSSLLFVLYNDAGTMPPSQSTTKSVTTIKQ